MAPQYKYNNFYEELRSPFSIIGLDSETPIMKQRSLSNLHARWHHHLEPLEKKGLFWQEVVHSHHHYRIRITYRENVKANLRMNGLTSLSLEEKKRVFGTEDYHDFCHLSMHKNSRGLWNHFLLSSSGKLKESGSSLKSRYSNHVPIAAMSMKKVLGIAAVKWGEIPIASGLHFAYCMVQRGSCIERTTMKAVRIDL